MLTSDRWPTDEEILTVMMGFANESISIRDAISRMRSLFLRKKSSKVSNSFQPEIEVAGWVLKQDRCVVSARRGQFVAELDDRGLNHDELAFETSGEPTRGMYLPLDALLQLVEWHKERNP